jgi:hypothetical protein
MLFQRQAGPCNEVHERLAHRQRRIDARLEPQSEEIEAPGGGPANQRSEGHSVEQRTSGAKARPVVVPSQKADAIPSRDVLPVAGTLSDDGTRVG